MKLLIAISAAVLAISGCAPVERSGEQEVCKKYTISFGNPGASYYYEVDEIVKDEEFYYVRNIKYPHHSLYRIVSNKCEVRNAR